MEKRRPSYDLDAIKAAIGSPATLAITNSALRDARMLGFDIEDVANVVANLERKMFFKSMTTFKDHRRWQDVYHFPVPGGALYVKFQDDLVTEFLLVSFKER